MRIVVDTNIVISGLFFGGYPRTIIEAINDGKCEGIASTEILIEYKEVIERFKGKTIYPFNNELTRSFFHKLSIIPTCSIIEASRDKDDNKFLECAVDGKALFIVSGDQDLLTIGIYEGIDIITAKDFCEQYLSDNGIS